MVPLFVQENYCHFNPMLKMINGIVASLFFILRRPLLQLSLFFCFLIFFILLHFLGRQESQKQIDGRHLRLISLAADAMAEGDVINSKLRELNRWDLSQARGVSATVAPAFYMRGAMCGQIMFPSWLGKNSSKTKFARMAREVHVIIKKIKNKKLILFFYNERCV